MNKRILSLVALAFFLVPLVANGQANRKQFIEQNYSKTEYRIEMRDGIQLHTVVYQPKDASREYPIVLNRTPYSCSPYGDAMAGRIGPSFYMEQEGYIFVKQDVRGRWNSEGSYDNMRPHVDGDSDIDESSDTYDTIEWLLANLQGHNGKVGITGISYPGFYSAAALPEAHPALVVSSPQAPIADFFFDDFHHQGAYILMYWTAMATFGYQHDGPTTKSWYQSVPISSQDRNDAYEFYMKLGPLKNSKLYYGKENFFWNQIVEHPNYDEFWQRRSILPHLKDIKTNVMTVGGWFDAEDLYGPLEIYKTIEKENPDAFNILVMGPWEHGGWARASGPNRVGKLVFGQTVSDFYQHQIEAPFFRHFLKGEGDQPDFEALVYDTGTQDWSAYQQWPPPNAESMQLYMHSDGKLWSDLPSGDARPSEFVSDPANPVPYRKRSDLKVRFTPRPYMSDDQRFATERDDVLVFQSDVLEEDVTIAGDITAHLNVSITGTDSDWIVKVIDVYPDEMPDPPAGTHPSVEYDGYQQMVRSEVLRGRFRNSFASPEPFEPNKITEVDVKLQDIYHTFKKGHRVMVHVQSTWFPLIDRNPQKYVDNIYEADEEDFIKATHRLYHSPDHPSSLEVRILK